MIILLDTSVIIDIDNRMESTLESLASLKASYPALPRISFMTYFEVIHGLSRMQPRRKQNSLAFIENFDVVQTTKATASVLSALRDKYGDLPFSDLFIAAQAMENNMILVTKDNDFSRIEGLDKAII